MISDQSLPASLPKPRRRPASPRPGCPAVPPSRQGDRHPLSVPGGADRPPVPRDGRLVHLVLLVD